MKLSVIIPAFNEGKYLKTILDRVLSVPMEKEIIIVDDGSSDGSWDILKSFQQSNVKIYRHTENTGKGYAVRTGLRQVTGDIVIIQDADLEYDPNDYPRLVEPILTGNASVVYGSRRLGRTGVSYARYYWGSWFLNLVANLLYRTQITDLYTCYKAFKFDVVRDLALRCRGFEFCPEVTAKISKGGYKIVEVPISYQPRSFSQGKKIRWHDGVVGLWTLIRYRFGKP